jgi:hypothetical protein
MSDDWRRPNNPAWALQLRSLTIRPSCVDDRGREAMRKRYEASKSVEAIARAHKRSHVP